MNIVMILLILLSVGVSQDSNMQLFSSDFEDSQITINNWFSNGNSYSSKFDCNRSPNKLLKINTSGVQKQFTSLPVHHTIRIEFDAYFINSKNADLYYYLDGVLLGQIIGLTTFSNYWPVEICYKDNQDYQTSKSDKPSHTSSTLTLKFVASTNDKIGIRNLNIFIFPCNRLCTACTNTNVCTACVSNAILNTNTCTCPIDQQYYSPTNGCINRCSTNEYYQKSTDSCINDGSVLEVYEYPDILATTTPSSMYVQTWTYDVYTDTTFYQAYPNPILETTLTFINVHTQLQFQVVITILDMWTTDTLIFNLDGINLGILSYDGTNFVINNNGFIQSAVQLPDYSSQQVMRIAIVFQIDHTTNAGSAVFNVDQSFQSITTTWGISHFRVAVLNCPLNCGSCITCISCTNMSYCTTCTNSKVLYRGSCIDYCPINSKWNSQNKLCVDYIHMENKLFDSSLPQDYLGTEMAKWFTNYQFTNTFIDTVFTQATGSSDYRNQMNTKAYSYCRSDKMLGGFGSWVQFSYTATFSGLITHSKLRMYSKVYQMDEWSDSDDNFSIYVDNQLIKRLTYNKNNDERICGNGKKDIIQYVWSKCTHSASTMTLKLDCNPGKKYAVNASCGIKDILIYSDYDWPICSGTMTYSIRTESCQPCLPPCATCQYFDNYCVTCSIGTLIKSGQLSICVTVTCATNEYYNQTTASCSTCSIYCLSCSIDANNCLTCDGTLNRTLNTSTNSCDCNDNYYDNNTTTCQQCTNYCLNCTSSTYCTSCSTSDQRYLSLTNTCECEQGYYQSGTMATCQPCDPSCATCSQFNTHCDQCSSLAFRILINNTCICQDGYYQLGNLPECQLCSITCQTCVGSPDVCTSCYQYMNRSLQDNTCKCQMGYYSNSSDNTLCQSCHSQCQSCLINSTNCTICNQLQHRILTIDKCTCEDGYYDNGSDICSNCSNICMTCISINQCQSCYPVQLRIYNQLTLQCQCMDGYYDNGSQTICQQCYYLCRTCIYNSIQCTSCYPQQFRSVDTAHQCICSQGYYYNGNDICQQCHASCLHCVGTNTNCLSCVSSKILIANGSEQTCTCKVGYYYYGNDICLQCHYTCASCVVSDLCLTCNNTSLRSLYYDNCNCNIGYYDTPQQQQCNKCQSQCVTCSVAESCTSCDTTLFKVLSANGNCVCQQDYYVDPNQLCQSCNSSVGILQQQCQYKDCSDGVWTWGEQCDDGNTLSRDGCTNCNVDDGFLCNNILMAPSMCYQCTDYCINCTFNDNKSDVICLQCQSGYFLRQGYCTKCANKCSDCEFTPDHCLSCRFLEISQVKCQLCELLPGLYSDYITNQCYSKCGDSIQVSSFEQCDDGNNYNGDGCDSLCQVEYGYYCNSDGCIKYIYPQPYLTQKSNGVYNNNRTIILQYYQPIFINAESLSEYIQLSITNMENLTYQISIKESDNQSEYMAIFELLLAETCVGNNLTMIFSDVSLIQSQDGSFQIEHELSIAIDDFYLISDAAVSATQSTIDTNQYLMYIILMLIGLAVLSGGIEIFYNLLDILQLVSYLQYVNTRYPYNLDSYFQFFQFAQLTFISNYINLQAYLAEYINMTVDMNIPEKIQQDREYSLAIVNIESTFEVWVTLIFAYLAANILILIFPLFKIRVDLNKDSRLIIKIKNILFSIKTYLIDELIRFDQQFIYSALIRTHIATSYDYCFAIMLNLYDININSNHITVQFSAYFTIALLIIYLAVIICCIRVASLQIYSIKLKSTQNKYGAIFESLNINKQTLSIYYNIFLLIKKFLFMATLIMNYDQPQYQIINMAFLSLIQVLFIILVKPFEEDYEMRKQLQCEVLLMITQFTILIFVIDDTQLILTESHRELIGWICIGLVSAILLVQIVLDVYQQLKYLLKKVRFIRSMVKGLNRFYRKIMVNQPLQLRADPNTLQTYL